MTIVNVGVSYRTAPAGVLEQLAVPADQHSADAARRFLQDGVPEDRIRRVQIPSPRTPRPAIPQFLQPRVAPITSGPNTAYPASGTAHPAAFVMRAEPIWLPIQTG